MRRRLFTFAPLLSLLFCAASAAMWLTTLRWEMLMGHTSMYPIGPDWQWQHRAMWSVDAGLFFELDRWVVGNPHFTDQRAEKPGQWNYDVQPLGTNMSPMGYPANLRPLWIKGVIHQPSGVWLVRSRYVASLYVPYWRVLLLTVPLPLVWLTRLHRSAFRRKHSLCGLCGYNLTANTSGVCPECGTMMAGNVEAKA